MAIKYLPLVLIICFIKNLVYANENISQNEIIDSNYGSDQAVYGAENGNPVQTYPNALSGETWYGTAQKLMVAPAGQIAVQMAKEMISRSTGNSQILSLNLTNLLILVLLKALIFAAGLIGAGNWGQYARARNIDSPFIQNDEVPLFIGFLALEGSGNDGCLNLAACKSPEIAKDYLMAARAAIKGAEMFDNRFLNSTRDYSYTINQLERSIQKGIDGASCSTMYHCHL